jgi:hypothetical protein
MALEIPNTESATVARMAVAWNIVHAANYPATKMLEGSDQVRIAMFKAYIETYNAILEHERSAGKPQET